MNVVDRDTVMCISLAARPGNHGNRFHNFLYAELGLNFLYKSFTSSDIGATIAGVRSLGIRGVSVSMPYKESCMPFLDALDPSAAAIDSVNTIVNDGGVLTGYNTDYLAVRALLDDVPRGPFALRGSGGMAKAVLAVLVDSGFDDGVVVARNETAGRALAERYGVAWSAGLDGRRPGLLCNATPIGMSGGPGEHDLAFEADAVRAAGTVLEAVYLPAETPLVRLAREAGARVIAGGAIMELQALEQFVRYTGVRPTADQVARAEAYAAG
ncbi:MAG: shikimate 5-dehydrogenase [Actinomycetales bacterium]|nr:shikimate 5-dehydrogenase [Actinomycetales bacterium]